MKKLEFHPADICFPYSQMLFMHIGYMMKCSHIQTVEFREEL